MNYQEIAEHTLKVMHDGYYLFDQQPISIVDQLNDSIAKTIEYDSESKFDIELNRAFETRIFITNETTLARAKIIHDSGTIPFVLNFASAKRPGGGFLRGAVAQEETLARSSGLYHTLLTKVDPPTPRAFYNQANPSGGAFYSDAMIYSPVVPVFKLDSGELLCQPYLTTFLTAAAPNFSVIPMNRENLVKLETTMLRRINKVLSVAALHKHTHLVLGAWGCGVFNNPPHTIATLFKMALEDKFKGVFQEVNFSILDTSFNQKNFNAFKYTFQ